MTTTEIREALVAVERAVDVPPVDQVAFQARVRAERRRRTAGRVLVGSVAAVAVVAAGITGNAVLGGSDRSPVAVLPQETGDVVPETVFFVVDGRLSALDPHGNMHDLGQRSEGVVGWTPDRVFALDDDSHVVVRRTEPPFREVASPVPGPTQSVALSGDGLFLAWLDTDDQVHRYNLGTGAEDVTFAVGPGSAVTGVSARGVLVAEGYTLRLRDGELSIPVPTQAEGLSFASDVAGDLVLVNDRDGQSLLYDTSEGTARLLDTFTGVGALGPYGERVAVIVPEPADRARVEVWDGGTMLDVEGLEGLLPITVHWADETTLLVAGSADGQDRLYACDIDLQCARLPVEGELSLS